MKIRISMPGRSLSVEVEDNHAISVFNRVALQMLGASKLPDIKPISGNESAPQKMEVPKKDTYIVEDSQLHRYKGFLYLKCPSCGKIKGFCSKEEIKGYHCFDCGADNPFEEELVPLWVNCECGKSFKYMTNLKEESFDIECIDCGNPVAIKWNEKKGIYEPMRN